MITNGGLVNYLQYAIATYPFAAGSGSPLHSTLSFDLTVTSLYGPLLVGGWTELMSESRGLEAAWQEGTGYGVVKLTPAHLRLLNSTEESAERLRQWSTGVIVGGEALSWEQVRAWVAAGVRVYNEYGPTETVVGSCVYELEAGAEERGANGGVPIGWPIHNTELYVLDQWQRPVAVGVRGELYIGGAGLGRGYWGRAELTAERFVPHPYSGRGGERLYRTGDEGRYLEDGRIEYLGRRDQQVKVRGYRIELGEIEAVLESHAAVRQAVVMMREDRAGDQRLVAYLIGSKESDIEDLKLHVSEKLPAYMVPQAWMIMEAVPLTKNGKLDRAALPIPERQTKKTISEPLTTLQQAVAAIWAEVLEIDQIDLNENFFELGGHSLLGAQVISRVREVFNIDIYLRSLFEQPTLARFSAAIEECLIAEILALPEEALDGMALH
jgi:non-ribosomal peptide synthetase component F